MSTPDPPKGGAPSLGPLLVGVVAGLAAFGLLLGAGIVLYQRVYGESSLALLVIVAIFGGLGAYLAWLVGVLVFSRARNPEDGDG